MLPEFLRSLYDNLLGLIYIISPDATIVLLLLFFSSRTFKFYFNIAAAFIPKN